MEKKIFNIVGITIHSEKEVQIKTTMRYHLTPFSIAIIKNKKIKCWQGCGDIGIFVDCCRM